MKIAILFAAFTTVAYAGVVVPAAPVGLIESGSSRVARTEDNLGNYAFGYDEVHTTGGSFRREQASPNGGVTGSYGLRDADGRLRTVNYIADAAGFRAAITSNEPGVESKNTAGALYNQGEVPPGPVIDETLLLEPAVPAGRLLAAPTAYGPGPAVVAAPGRLLAAPAPVALQHAPLTAQVAQPLYAQPQPAQLLAAPAPIQFAQQLTHAHAAPLVAAAPVPTQAVNALNHGPFLGAPGISAPVLNAPGVDVFGRLTNAAVPTVNSNPLVDGPFARFQRPALSTPGALATGPLAAPLSPFQPTPLASPQLAASGQLLSAPVPAGPLAPGVAAVAAPLAAPVAAAPLHAHPQLLAQQQLLSQQQLVHGNRLLAAPVHGQVVHQQIGVAPAAIAGIAYQTQINHQLVPAAPLAAAVPAGHFGGQFRL